MRFYWGIHPKCSLCPLFDAERAVRDALGENPPPGLVLEISFGPNLRALVELPPNVDPDWQVPDYLPAEWGQDAGEEPAG